MGCRITCLKLLCFIANHHLLFQDENELWIKMSVESGTIINEELTSSKQLADNGRPSNQRNSRTNVWYCPSRWLMAHHDPQADIYTLSSSHMCLADLNNENENLLALIDFKKRPSNNRAQIINNSSSSSSPPGSIQPPYNCRLRVYRGQQLIYNHFLDDMPACLIATSIRGPVSVPIASMAGINRPHHQQVTRDESQRERTLLTVAINDDIYFYHRLKASHRVSLEDEDCIMESLNKSECDIWRMVKQNKVDVETMRELLVSLSNELGPNELTSHSNNFLALETNEERKNYLLLWKFKRLSNGIGEHLMSMDTICCAAARLKYSSSITRSGDYGYTRDQSGGLLLNNPKWNRILDLQKDGLIVGTEDRHLLIYELRLTKAILETHYRLASTPDHILVERRSPASLDPNCKDLKNLTYKILISCRNCRIYTIDQHYIVDNLKQKSNLKELLALKCNVLDICWTSDGDENSNQPTQDGASHPNFVVACLDRRVYCFGSRSGQCKWVIETELPVTCLVSLPAAQSSQAGSNVESRLIGIASQASRIDFHLSQTGRIVDSIYFNGDDNCQAMTFGRFGREDNCLCLTTKLGHLLIFILKRTAKFAHGQCLSSAASHASSILSNCSHLFQQQAAQNASSSSTTKINQHQLRLNEPPSLPTPFALAKSCDAINPTDQAIELLQAEHSCDQILAKSTLDARLVAPPLQVPVKSRDFVDQIVDQSRHSTAMSRVFAKHMIKLRDKIRTTIEQQSVMGKLESEQDSGNRITLLNITGLGNTYRASLSLRLNLKRYAEHHLLSDQNNAPLNQEESFENENSNFELMRRQKESSIDLLNSEAINSTGNSVVVLLFVQHNQQQQQHQFQCQVKPFRFELNVGSGKASNKGNQWIFEKTIEFKLLTGPINRSNSNSNIANTNNSEPSAAAIAFAAESESVSLDVYIMFRSSFSNGTNEPQRPVFISSLNIPTC